MKPLVLAVSACLFFTACSAQSGAPIGPEMPRPAVATGSGQGASRVTHFWFRDKPVRGSRPRAVTFPGDVQNHGGQVVTSMTQYVIGVNCAVSCWGDPKAFLIAMGHSTMIHLTDQYTNATSKWRYTRVGATRIAAPLPHVMLLGDVANLVHAAVSKISGNPTGYANEYHLFLKQGQDVCLSYSSSSGGACYSPDNFYTFTSCAFHGYFDFSDFGHTLVSIEPYQDIPACSITGATPNGRLADSTDSTLSRMLFGTITDPDSDGWWNGASLYLFGSEIGDECQQTVNRGVPVDLNGQTFQVQQEYSNAAHACLP